MIIIEGPDAVGKTTLAHALVKRLQEHAPYVYRHFDKPGPCWQFPDSYIDNMQLTTVCDRFYIFDLVYRQANNESQRITPEMQRVIDAHLRLLGAVTVIVTADSEWLAARLRERVDSEGMDANHYQATIEEAQRANGVYRERFGYGLSEQPDWDFFHHVIRGDDYPAQCPALVDRILAKYQARQAELFGVAEAPSSIPAIKR